MHVEDLTSLAEYSFILIHSLRKPQGLGCIKYHFGLLALCMSYQDVWLCGSGSNFGCRNSGFLGSLPLVVSVQYWILSLAPLTDVIHALHDSYCAAGETSWQMCVNTISLCPVSYKSYPVNTQVFFQ